MSGNALLDFILLSLTPCSHQSQSWPMRLSGETGAHRTCLECGQRRRYSLLDPENRAAPDKAGASHPPSTTTAALFPAGAFMQTGNGSD
jgi:hypothetical protein